jgi:predicted nucleotidyltransferase
MTTRTSIDEELFNAIVRRLIDAVDPDRIILFGSHARGDAGPDSDVDLLIVKDTTAPVHKRAIAAYRSLRGLGVSKDIIWRTPSEIKDWAAVPTYVTTRALCEGRVLYEKRG